ncbi:cytochrome P450 [Lactarius indigo]|nr:cytochrome P450 [Lactarius indigo]
MTCWHLKRKLFGAGFAPAVIMFSLIHFIDLSVLLSFFIAFRSIHGYQRRKGLPYPPGPPGWPIIGNLLDILPTTPWLVYTEFSKKYGHIVSYRVLGKDVVVLSTTKAIKDLLEKRGDIYSGRPIIPFFDMMEWDWMVPFTNYGEAWHRGRKALDRGLRPNGAAAYRPMQQERVRVLLTRLLATPNDWRDHVELFQGELILDMTYGYEAKGRGDRRLDVAIRLGEFGTQCVLPGALLVNELPFLRHIPAWLPYISYKPLAEFGRKMGQEVVYEPMQFVKKSIASGTARPSLALEHFQEIEKLSGSERGEAEKTLAGALASLYTAGADTTVSSMVSLLVACLLRPDVQKKAQDEIDAIVGRERLPTFEDRPRLPFVDAMCQEVMRWQPVVPLAVPHMASEDGVYEGFFIPKGALIIGNTWALLRDPSIYPEPDAYKPERFLNPDGSLRDDPLLLSAFGYGKRICPGRHFVDTTLFIYAASLLSVFRIEDVQDGQGRRSEYKYGGQVIRRPELFPCSIIPRDKRAEELIIADTMAR